MSKQTIYFDVEDAFIDGNGWNVVDEGSVAARFPTRHDALVWCATHGYDAETTPLSAKMVADVLYKALATCRPWIDDFRDGDVALELYEEWVQA